MKPKYSVIVFFFLLICSISASVHSYRFTQQEVEKDLNTALWLTLKEKTEGWITPDTIRSYRSNISIPWLRDYAYISYCLPDEKRIGITSRSMKWHGDGRTLSFRGYANCTMATLLSLSDQRLPMTLVSITLLWGMFSICVGLRKRQHVAVVAKEGMLSVGGLYLDRVHDCFVDQRNQEIHLTPMQHQLMKLFFSSENHRLAKEDICNALWPKKEDASDTLYTLIKRIRPVLEQHSHLKITSDRGRAYQLTLDE
ncbi:MAG: helix-turn-helix domain-containing protein [Prevotella sp.]|jgi:hypothetical protein|nr:helix-turn-helix domain-containing protein [Prevotella sp.]MCI2080651.1 helix-turn-helix domain-containing protein [Prevotella sp.]MCI2102579.1 helix-turn-helix domain-containing protein [Prevotella sp.]HCN54647.1 transcriptional regulator [Prevotella sp.]